MEQASAANLLSAEDVVLEILHRVSADVAALFRCSVACKRWRALVADRSFLRRCWPENARGPSTQTQLLGFFDRQRVVADMTTPWRLFFVPPPAGSVLGAQPRLLTTIVDGLRDDDSQSAEPLAARRGLLLLRLVSGTRYFESSVNMAVCDPVARTRRVLPPLECRVSFVSCTVLTGAECRQHHQRSADSFVVLAIVIFINPKNKDDQECNLYTFSSAESRWSAPTKCFDEIGRIGKRGFRFLRRSNGANVVVHGAKTHVHWLVEYYLDHVVEPPKHYTFDVSTDTGRHTSLTELPIPSNQLGAFPALRVAADGSLSLFCIDDGSYIRRLHMWKRGNGIDNKVVWLHTRAIELNLPRQTNDDLWKVHILPVEKSDTLFFIDENQCMHKIDVETETVEEQRFKTALSMSAVPMNIEWPTLFSSRLG